MAASTDYGDRVIGDDREDSTLDAWLDRVSGRIAFVTDIYDYEITLDYSPGSLGELEEFLVGRYETPAALLDHDEVWVVEGAIGYVGEMLARLAGGGWRAADDPNRVYRCLPVIEADQALRIPPASPSDLVLAAVRGQTTGEVFRQAYEDWERAVSGYRAAHPSWLPTRRPTPGIEPVAPTESEVRYLREWLATREGTFPDWVASYGTGIAWDHSPESLDALGELVLGRTPTVPEVEDPANAAFIDGAAWYCGETWRRVRDGRWCYWHGDPDAAVYEGYPFVESPEPDGKKGVPFRALRLTVKRRDPHLLRGQYDVFVSH
jgi:hypothetical protein